MLSLQFLFIHSSSPSIFYYFKFLTWMSFHFQLYPPPNIKKKKKIQFQEFNDHPNMFSFFYSTEFFFFFLGREDQSMGRPYNVSEQC